MSITYFIIYLLCYLSVHGQDRCSVWGVLLQWEGVGVGASVGAIGGGRRTISSVEHHCWGRSGHCIFFLVCPTFQLVASLGPPLIVSLLCTWSYQMKKGVMDEENPEAKFSVALSAQSPLQLTLTSSALQLLKQLAEVWTVKAKAGQVASVLRYYTHCALHTCICIHIYVHVCLPFSITYV